MFGVRLHLNGVNDDTMALDVVPAYQNFDRTIFDQYAVTSRTRERIFTLMIATVEMSTVAPLPMVIEAGGAAKV